MMICAVNVRRKKRMKIKIITEGEKSIGKEIECACGCKKILKCFNDKEDGKLEFVLHTVFAKKEEQWKHNFIISKKDLVVLIKEENSK